MNRRDFFRLGLPVAATPLLRTRTASAQAQLPAAGADGWISLFNGRNLDGWYTFLQTSGKGAAEKNGYVKVEEGLLHIMGNDMTTQSAESGYLATNQEFENVRIRVEYKWGVKRFPPRLENKRDNGVLYHIVGTDRVWPTCVECQVQETDTGDYFMLGGTRATQGQLPGNGGAGYIQLINAANRVGGPGGAAPAGGAAGTPPAGWRCGRGAHSWRRTRQRARADERAQAERRRFRKARRLEHRRSDRAEQSIDAPGQRAHRQSRVEHPAARSAESGTVHSAHAREDWD